MKDYWRKRQAQHIEDILSKANVSAKEIAKVYTKSSFYLNEQIQGIYDRYKKKHGLSDIEAMDLLNKLEDPTSYDEMLNRLRSSAKTDERKQLLKELEAPAYRYRINRLQESQKAIDQLMRNIYNQEKDISTLNYINIANDAYYKSIYNLQQGTGLAFSFENLDPQLIDKLLKSSWSGENYSSRIWNNTQAVANSVKEEMLLGMLTGKTEREMAQTITDKFLVGAYQARRLVNTESAFICNAIDMEAYKEADVEQVRFCAIHDLKTSKICQQHDRKVVSVNKAVQGVNIPPLHPNCRSTIEPVIDKKIEAKMKRRTRNPVTGKEEIVNANETYEQWYERIHGNKLDKTGWVEEKVSIFDDNVNKSKIDKEYIQPLPDIFKYSDIKSENLFQTYIEIDKGYLKTGNEYLSINHYENGSISKLGIMTSNDKRKVGLTENAINFIESQEENSLISIHNHPSSGTFSIGDVITHYNTPQLKESIVINADGGIYHLHIRSRNGMLKVDSFKNYVKGIRKQLKGTYASLSNNEINHIAWELIAKELGWDYGYEKIR